MKAMDVKVTGRVQGVSFRAWTRAEATRLDLLGWVCNHDDGSVVAHFEGSPDRLAEMERQLHQGPAAARVVDVISKDAAPAGAETFEIRS